MMASSSCDLSPYPHRNSPPVDPGENVSIASPLARIEASTGLRILSDGMEAFAARVALIRAAQATLDIQYYIWHDDLSGLLLLDEVEQAAERGVAVRLLLDDNGIAGLDARLADLADRPGIAVRLFNPFRLRRPKAINWLFDFARLNRRMHAKSLTADGRLTILGGRNVGDEYFDAKADGLFEDLDVFATGAIVADITAAFERHWLDPRARCAEDCLRGVSARSRRRAVGEAEARVQSDAAARYRDAVRDRPLVTDMRDGEVDLHEASARVIAHGPFAPNDPVPAQTGLDQLLPAGLGTIERELVIVSGYFVPTEQGCGDLADLARSGVRVRVLTNSFAATDVGLVHAGYAPCRSQLLAGGVDLFEMPAPDDKPKTARKFIRPGSVRTRELSGRSLHAKVYIADRQRIYIGSANFDPRSVYLNSELGLVIDDADLAEAMIGAFDRATASSYRLGLVGESVIWNDLRDDDPQAESIEPGTSIISRLLVRLLSRLPLAHQL